MTYSDNYTEEKTTWFNADELIFYDPPKEKSKKKDLQSGNGERNSQNARNLLNQQNLEKLNSFQVQYFPKLDQIPE